MWELATWLVADGAIDKLVSFHGYTWSLFLFMDTLEASNYQRIPWGTSYSRSKPAEPPVCLTLGSLWDNDGTSSMCLVASQRRIKQGSLFWLQSSFLTKWECFPPQIHQPKLIPPSFYSQKREPWYKVDSSVSMVSGWSPNDLYRVFIFIGQCMKYHRLVFYLIELQIHDYDLISRKPCNIVLILSKHRLIMLCYSHHVQQRTPITCWKD
jgi:hypothetical protein